MIRQSSELPRGESTEGLEEKFGVDGRKRSSVSALSPGRSGIPVGSDFIGGFSVNVYNEMSCPCTSFLLWL